MKKQKNKENQKIKKILIANRGEIACRVISTCKALGIEVVTVYKKGEEDLPHVLEADESVCLGDGPLLETYLNQQLLVSIANEFQVDAIHPGYGFLSENSKFADKVLQEGIIFIGPSSESMVLMGDKKESKIRMEELGVPLIPGYHGIEQGMEALKKEAFSIGYPLLIKATAGGGGKGMRIVHFEEEFADALAGAKREAMNAFGNDQVLLEKFISSSRHIEIQVFSDSHGNHVHLYERECSIQRRYQKIVEESPSLAVNQKLRDQMTEVATNITRGIGYLGAGTIEFMLDIDSNFYFLEMNTRLQVEHPVTEFVTGLDLVEWQIKVSEGQKLPLRQDQIKQNGHAIEVRIYAEDPDNGFLPSIGTLRKVGPDFGECSLNGLRCDTGYLCGNKVSVDFDPMCAKLIAHGSDRAVAINKLKMGLNHFPFSGIVTNKNYLLRILKSDAFLKGETFTDFIDKNKDQLKASLLTDLPEEDLADMIAFHLFKTSKKKEEEGVGEAQGRIDIKPWDSLPGLRVT